MQLKHLYISIFCVILVSCRSDIEKKEVTIMDLTSAAAAVMESIGDAEVTIEYDRLMASDTVWQGAVLWKYMTPGESVASVFSVSKPVTIHGEILQAGSYNLFFIPEEISEDYTPGISMDWTIIFTQAAHHQRREFNPNLEVLRVKTRAQFEDNSKERMEYFFDQSENHGRIVRFFYEYVEVNIPISEPAYKADEIAEAMVMNAIGHTEIEVKYYRNRIDKKKPIGKTIPCEKEWIASVVKPTTIEFRDAVIFENQHLNKGKYKLGFIPKERNEWELNLSTSENDHDSVVFNSPVKVSFSESGP